jgi:hypothetical protein
MRLSRSFVAIVGTCALLLLPGSAMVSAQSADEPPMMEEHADDAQMATPAMDARPDMQAMPAADATSTMDPDSAMMTDHGTMPDATMPETQAAP